MTRQLNLHVRNATWVALLVGFASAACSSSTAETGGAGGYGGADGSDDDVNGGEAGGVVPQGGSGVGGATGGSAGQGGRGGASGGTAGKSGGSGGSATGGRGGQGGQVIPATGGKAAGGTGGTSAGGTAGTGTGGTAIVPPLMFGQLKKQTCPVNATTTAFVDFNITTNANPEPLHPSIGAVNADNTKVWAGPAGRIFDIVSGAQVGQLASGGDPLRQWSSLTKNAMFYMHQDGSFRRQLVYEGSGESTIFTAAQVGYTQVTAGPYEGLLMDDQDRFALFMGKNASGGGEIFVWDNVAKKKLQQTQPVTWGGHDFISMTHGGQFVAVKSVPQGGSGGPWWFYRIGADGLGPRVVSATKNSEHAAPAMERGVDRWVDAGGLVIDMATGATVRTLCGFWSTFQHVHGVHGHDSVVFSNNNRLSLIFVDGSGGYDLGPYTGGESYAQSTRHTGAVMRAVFTSNSRIVQRTF
jgi:hypothetical protein